MGLNSIPPPMPGMTPPAAATTTAPATESTTTPPTGTTANAASNGEMFSQFMSRMVKNNKVRKSVSNYFFIRLEACR